jgi:uncharacterized membrane protein YesL
MQIDMGTNEDNKTSKWITKLPYLLILFTSLLISIVGGCVLGWWLHKYHPTIIVLLSILVPDLCISKSDKQVNHSEPK